VMRQETPDTVEVALAEAERKGFRLAVIGRTCALVAISAFYGGGAPFPRNVYIAGLILEPGKAPPGKAPPGKAPGTSVNTVR
jgi:hypothetical protein